MARARFASTSRSPCCSIPAIMDTLFTIPMGNDRSGWGQNESSYPPDYENSPQLSHSLVSIHMEHKYPQVFLPT